MSLLTLLLACGRREERPINLDLLHQQHHFGVSPDKISTERRDHSKAGCKLAVEGLTSICEISAGSGVAFGLRAITGGSGVRGTAQALSISKLSAQHQLTARRGQRVPPDGGEGLCSMGLLLCGGLLFIDARGFGAVSAAGGLLGLHVGHLSPA